MNDFLSKISNQIIGPMILSTFFPVVLFVAAFALVVLPLAPFGQPWTGVVKNPADWQKNGIAVLEITFLVLVLSVVIYNLNTPIVRMYEGYPWRDSYIGKFLQKRQQSKLERASLIRRCIAKLRIERLITGTTTDLGTLPDVQTGMARLVNDAYPNKSSLVLPTHLGNVIRAFETYTTRQYGAGAISLWPRLVGVLDSSFVQTLDNAKMAFDFMINSAFLTLVLAAMSTAAGLVWKAPVAASLYRPWVVWALVFLFLSYLSYLAAINRAREWGTQVKSGFDLYRLTLLTKLGYQKPADLTEERRMWEVINYKFAFPDERTYPDLAYSTPATLLIVDPVSTMLTFERTVLPLDDGSIQIRVLVVNMDPTRALAGRVMLQDTIPTGNSYVGGSGTVNGASATVCSLNPMQIDLGPVPYYETRTVVYSIKSQSAGA